MKIDMRLALACGALVLGAALPRAAAAAVDSERFVTGWAEPSRLYARAMIDRYGRPDHADDDSLTWFGLFGGRKTVAHLAEPGQVAVEQSVSYRVPPEKAVAVSSFDPNIMIDRDGGEMSARAGSVADALLALNLAHEIASGFKTVEEAREFRDGQSRFAAAGKASRYREGLIFEQAPSVLPAPFVMPGGVNPPPQLNRVEP